MLVLNRLTEAMLSPFAKNVHVVPWGMDPKRFEGHSSSLPANGQPIRLLLAGIVRKPRSPPRQMWTRIAYPECSVSVVFHQFVSECNKLCVGGSE